MENEAVIWDCRTEETASEFTEVAVVLNSGTLRIRYNKFNQSINVSAVSRGLTIRPVGSNNVNIFSE